MVKTAGSHEFDHSDANESSDELFRTSCAPTYCCQRGRQFPDCHGLASKDFRIKMHLHATPVDVLKSRKHHHLRAQLSDVTLFRLDRVI